MCKYLQKIAQKTAPLAAVGILSVLGGCMDITGRGPAPLTKTVDAQQVKERPRIGHVYCMRGWLGIFSTGMDALANEIDTQVAAVSVADEEWRRLKSFIIQEKQQGRLSEPLVLLGHSWGADDQIRVCEALKEANIGVDLLVLIDPVTPPLVPTNVKRCVCIYKSHPLTDWYPFWRGVSATAADPKATRLTNIDLRTADVGWDTTVVDHINIEKVPGVHQMAIAEIEKTCPPRTTGVAGKPSSLGGAAGIPAVGAPANTPVSSPVGTP